MPAAEVDLVIEQGSTWKETFEVQREENGVLVPDNLTGYTARMQARSSYPSDTKLIDLSTANGGIIIDGPNGMVTFQMSATATALLDWNPTQKYLPITGVYQVEIESADGTVERLLVGKITLDPEIVR